MVTHQEITNETPVAHGTKIQNPILATSSAPAKRPIQTRRRRNAGVRRRLAFKRAFQESITLPQQDAGAQPFALNIAFNAEVDKPIAASSVPAFTTHVFVAVFAVPSGPRL